MELGRGRDVEREGEIERDVGILYIMNMTGADYHN